MPRIQPVTNESADGRTQEVLDSVKKKLGKVPNIIATMANSPAAANAYLGFSQALAGGMLPARLREQIALVVGETNKCDYCVAAHTALGKKAGLSDAETVEARRGEAVDAKERVALDFAGKIVDERGWVADLVNGEFCTPGELLCPAHPAQHSQNLSPARLSEKPWKTFTAEEIPGIRKVEELEVA